MDFLSDEWITCLDRALAAVTAPGPLVFEQLVTGVPGRGDVRYQVWIDHDGGHAGPGARRADVRFTTDYATACAIARGEENAQIALAYGRLTVGGDMETLTRHASALAAVGDAAAGLRAATTYGAEHVG
jgi:hypothetical protein